MWPVGMHACVILSKSGTGAIGIYCSRTLALTNANQSECCSMLTQAVQCCGDCTVGRWSASAVSAAHAKSVEPMKPCMPPVNSSEMVPSLASHCTSMVSANLEAGSEEQAPRLEHAHTYRIVLRACCFGKHAAACEFTKSSIYSYSMYSNQNPVMTAAAYICIPRSKAEVPAYASTGLTYATIIALPILTVQSLFNAFVGLGRQYSTIYAKCQLMHNCARTL